MINCLNRAPRLVFNTIAGSSNNTTLCDRW